jgi:SAM-dependent methyltransferase
MDIQKLANNLVLSSDEIWVSPKISKVAFPDDGHQECNFVEAESFWFKHRNDSLISVMEKFPPDGAIFDIGAGNGYVAQALKIKGFDAVAVEPGLTGARNAKSKGLTVICSTLEDAGFFSNSMDAIGLFDVLEHIEDDLQFLSKLKELLKKNGRLYITVPAYKFLWSTEDEITGHFRRYTLNNLKKGLSFLGYKVEYSTYFFSFLPLPIFLLRTIPSKLGWRQEGNLETTEREHKVNQGLGRSLLEIYLSLELKLIGKQKFIPFGGSCLVVAKKQ